MKIAHLEKFSPIPITLVSEVPVSVVPTPSQVIFQLWSPKDRAEVGVISAAVLLGILVASP